MPQAQELDYRIALLRAAHHELDALRANQTDTEAIHRQLSAAAVDATASLRPPTEPAAA
jgi:hypothetical protein